MTLRRPYERLGGFTIEDRIHAFDEPVHAQHGTDLDAAEAARRRAWGKERARRPTRPASRVEPFPPLPRGPSQAAPARAESTPVLVWHMERRSRSRLPGHSRRRRGAHAGRVTMPTYDYDASCLYPGRRSRLREPVLPSDMRRVSRA